MIVQNDSSAVVFGIVFIIGGFFVFFQGFKLLKLKRKISDLATSKIRSLAMGLVELSGIAKASQTLFDPIYMQPCAYYNVKVQELRGSGKNTRWVTIYDVDSEASPFVISDATGEALIFPKGAQLKRNPTIQCQTGSIFGGSADAPTRSFMQAKGGSFLKSLKLTAHIVREGDPVFILGFACPQDQPRSSLSVSLQEASQFIKSNATLFKALDVNLDGQVDQVEWEKGLHEIQQQMEQEKMKKEMSKVPEKSESPLTLVRVGPDNLMVFATSEDEVISSLGWGSFFQVVLGPVLVVIGVFVLTAALKL